MDRLLEENVQQHLDALIKRYPQLEKCREELLDGYLMMEACYERGNKLLIAGNGGSATDAEHISAELMKSFKMKRPIKSDFETALKEVEPERGAYLAEYLELPLPAVPLVAHEAQITAFINDVEAVGVFAQQLLGYGKKGDVFLGITTSGDSENILHAAVVARAAGIQVLGLTGESGGKLRQFADTIVQVPEKETYRVQELHLPVYHCWCMMLEERFFGVGAGR